MKKLILAIFTIMLIFSGCTNKNLTEENATQLVNDFLVDFQSMDYDGMYALTHDGHPYFQGIYNAALESNSYMFETLSNNVQYQIDSVSVDGKEATVTATITNIDITKVLENITAEYLTLCEENAEKPDFDFDEAFLEVSKKNFDNPENETVTKQTVFNLVERNKQWAIESNIMIYDDVTGGYMTHYYANVVFSDLMNTETTTQN